MTANVLIISNPQDEHTVYVTEQLRQFDVVCHLFYPEHLTSSVSLALEHRQVDGPNKLQLFGALDVELDEIDSVWYRRPRLVAAPAEISTEGLEFARDEWRAALDALYALMRRPLWVSHPDRLKEAARKPMQLQMAQALGLCTPRTLITNNHVVARAFYDECSGRVIVKPTGSGWVYAQNSDDYFYVMTNRITAEDLTADDQLRTAPVTFQEEVAKAYELRVNIVGQEILAIQIDSQRSSISALDWRRYDVANTPYKPYELPETIAAKCLQLTQRLGLEFGAIDLICRPDGEYVFLEINGNGQFLWAEQLSGVTVSSALARLLAGITPPLSLASCQ
jgi:glutathione synthase/RimK-type ligase-like ATP-grasp enzyme